jgi:hypothetical protein
MSYASFQVRQLLLGQKLWAPLPRERLAGFSASAVHPCTGELVRVKVLCVRNTQAWGPTADVRMPGAILGFSVRLAELYAITAIYRYYRNEL